MPPWKRTPIAKQSRNWGDVGIAPYKRLSEGEKDMTIIFSNDNFGKNIQRLREARGMSRQELAAASGVEPGILAALEEGRLLEFDYPRFAEICRVLDESLENIIHGEPV